MKYIKTYENIRTHRSQLKNFDTDKIYLYQYKEYDEDDDYCYIVGKIREMAFGGVIITGYHINDKYEQQEGSESIRDNWFPSLYEANEEEIEKYNMFSNAKNYNL